MPRLLQLCNVYTENNTTGNFDVLALTQVRCRVAHIGGGLTLLERKDLADLRHFYYDGRVEIPEDCQIDVLMVNGSGNYVSAGKRYRPSVTQRELRGTGGSIFEKTVDIEEVRR